MSIIIKGMDMPNQCFYCPFWIMKEEGSRCRLIKRDIPFPDYLDKIEDCPLVEIPTPHGRLIDLGALPETRVEWEDIVNAPTILEAED